MTHHITQSHRQRQNHNQSQNQGRLRHPNVMTEAERLELPDPCRPIDERVIPARHNIDWYIQKPASQLGENTAAKQSKQIIEKHGADKSEKLPKKDPHSDEFDMMEPLISDRTMDVRQFIIRQQQQVNHTQTKHPSLYLPLSLLPQLVNDSSISLMKEVMSRYSHLAIMNTLPSSTKSQAIEKSHSSNVSKNVATNSTDTAGSDYNQALLNIETKLYLMGQIYHIMLCIFLLCQCKSRKSLNPQITLQDLANSINEYIEAHRTELHFLTQHDEIHIEAKHVELAALAMEWQVGKQASTSKRTTTISSQNPLTGG